MTNLRPMTTLANVTVTLTIESGESEHRRANATSYVRRVVYEDLGGEIPKWKEGQKDQRYSASVAVSDLTVSALIAFSKRLVSFQKELAKVYPWEKTNMKANTPKVDFKFHIGGDAEGYDFAKLAKEPSPKEDWDVLRKLRNKSELTNKRWARAFWLLGLEATPIKKGRKITGFTVEGVDHNEKAFEWGGPYPWTYDFDKDVRAVWISKASELMGLPDPALLEDLPSRARDYRTDLTIRTCPCCFRDIKASEHTGFRMADHGFQIQGRDWSGWGGWRSGSCKGVDRLPWEKSPEATKEMIPGLIRFSDELVRRYRSDPPAKLMHPSPQVYSEYGTEIDATHPKWEAAVIAWRKQTLRDLGSLWTGRYGSIPWFRAAVRTWKPVGDDVPAVGAPLCKPEAEDFNGKPAILSED